MGSTTKIDLLSGRLPAVTARRLFNLNGRVGIGEDRLRHIAGVVEATVKIGQGDFTYSWGRLIPANRECESMADYRQKMDWVFDVYDGLDQNARIDLEAGALLHDLGYARAVGAEHNEEGVKVLAEVWPETERILRGLSQDRMNKMIRYHGLLNDVGYQFLPGELKRFTKEELDLLALLGIADNMAKPWTNPQSDVEYRSMLFARTIARFQQLLTAPDKFDMRERLRSVFGPITYVWLKDDDYRLLLKEIEASGLPKRDGYHIIMNNVLMYCWPLFKDLITPRVEFATSFYTPLEPKNLAAFIELLHRLSDQLERSWDDGEQPAEIIVGTETDYFPFGSRDRYLAAVRRGDYELISQPPARLTLRITS